MSASISLTRRRLLITAGASILLASPALSDTAAIEVYRDPSCGCCGGWVEHLRKAGHAVTVREPGDLDAVKNRLGIPQELWACHSAVCGGYSIEGHVPAHAIARLLAEKPPIKGLAVPGMPVGSPGMEGGTPETYEVVAFTQTQRHVFGRYRGAQPA